MIKSIIIDSREPKWVQKLAFCGAKKAILEMEFGDLWITCDDGQTLVIERKEPEDFIGSMISNRLIRQAAGLAGLRKGGLWPYVMIMGELNPGPNGRTWVNGDLRDIQYTAIQGFLLSIQELGVFTVFAKNSKDLEDACIRLSNRDRSSIMKLPAVKRIGKKLDGSEEFLAGLPGISTELSALVMKEAGTAAHALEMMTTGEYLPKVGTKKREQIRKVLGLSNEEIIQVTKPNEIKKAHKAPAD